MYDKPAHTEKKIIDERAPENRGQDTPVGTPAAPADPYAPQPVADTVTKDQKAPNAHKNIKHPYHIPESGVPQEGI